MDGFSVRPDEMRSLSQTFRREAEQIGGHGDELRAGEVQSGDFGGPRHSDVGASYVEVSRDLLVQTVKSLRDNSSAMADKFEQTLAAYLRVDEDNRAGF